MFEDLGNLLSTAMGVMALASLAGVGLMRGTVTALRENLDDARKDNADVDRRLAIETREREAAQAEVAQLRVELGALGRVVTGEAHWVAIGQTLDTHHEEAQNHWLVGEGLLTEIRDLLKDRA